MTNITKAAQQALAALETCRIRSVTEWEVSDVTPKNVTQAIDALRAALQDKAGEVRDGFVLVPVEPTEAMIQAGIDEMPHFTDEPGPVWSAMLAASQQK